MKTQFKPVADTLTGPGRRYGLGTGHHVVCTSVGDTAVYFGVISCPCAGLSIESGRCCQGHAQTIAFDWATWKQHCASGWAREIAMGNGFGRPDLRSLLADYRELEGAW